MLEWLHQNDGHLPGFRIEQALEQKYFLGNIRVEAEIEEKIDWFDLHIVAVIGDERIPFQRFRRQILNGNRDFLLPDGKLLVLPEAWFRKYAALFKLGKEEKEGFRMRKIHAVLLKDMLAGDISPKKEEALKQLLTPPASPPAIPPGIKAKLRNYQKMGFQWLAHLYENGFGGCLADDMGLGKTLQSICLLQYVYQRIQERDTVEADGQLSFFQTAQTTTPASLIIVPTSLLHNWKNELQRFAPCLHTLVYNGNNRLKQPLHFEHYQAVLTSYGIVRKDIASLSTYPFQLLILDESQYIKNPESQIYKAVRQLQAASRFALTGTPLENSLEDLWAQFNFVNEGLLGDYHTFKETFMQPIKEKDTEKELLLKKMLRPFLLRRTKEEVTPELPLLSQEIVYCEMTEVHREAYEKEKNRIRNQMLAEKEDSANQKDRQRWNILALQGLNLLRQLANHPKMVDADYKGDSGKMNEIFRRLEILKAGGHKVLIFSSYVKQLKLVEHAFIEKNWKYALLTGQTFHREEEIRRFSQQEDCFCFLISLKAGSTGLNLTAADYAFILDPWWNPAAEMQALARAHRIGQTKPVIACRFISFNTIEEKILLLQAGKKDLYDTFVNTPYGNMPNQEELIQMFLD
ncbi:MAG: hypothetical protein LBL81_01485 [Tannerella sp.]|nr:hypothetical protein [Tannerella sp.]